MLLAGACGFDIGTAGAFAFLAQVPAALGVALLRGTRGKIRLGRDAGSLALLWAGGFALAGLLAAWPLQALRSAPGLIPTLALSAAVAAMLLLLWRNWPLWHGIEREGGGIGVRHAAQDKHERGAWSGLQVAVPVLLLLGGGIALAWPGLLTGFARTIAAMAYAALLPLAHALLQSAPSRLLVHGLPVVEMDDAEQADIEVDAVLPIADAAAEIDVEALTRDLYAAARAGRVERALQLLEAGADPRAVAPAGERDRRGLPVLAAVLPDLRLLRGLIERGVDINAAHAWTTPLLAATRDSWHGRPEAVMTLLANGADPRIADAEGNTPLHYAARSSDPGVAALLRDAGAEMDALNGEGVSPLGTACIAGNWRLARFLLERGAKPEPADGQPVLLAAAGTEEDDAAGVQLLLRHKARVDARDARGRSALHEAAFAGHAGIVAALLDAGADVHARDGEGRTPLLDSARNAALPALDALMEAKADPRACDGTGANALHLAVAAEAPSAALVKRLLELGVDAQAQDAEGRSVVDVAAAAGRWTLVSALDPQRDLPVAMDEDDGTAPDRPPQLLLRERLLEGVGGRELAPLAALLGTAEMNGLLCDAEIAAEPARIEWLLRHGAQAEARVPGAPLPVAAALARGTDGMQALRALFAHGASPAGGGGFANWLAACHAQPTKDPRAQRFALELLERGADPFAPSSAGDPPLALAVRLQWTQLLQRLVAHGVDLDARDSHGMSALHLAAALGREDELKRLVAAGAAPDRRAADGQTPLGVALAAGRRDLADWLDWRGWRLPRRPLQASDVPAAALVGDTDAVRRLLDFGLPVDAVDSQGCSALLRAAGGGHRALVDLLLARGANPGLAANTGATPLSAAVSMRQAEIVDHLLDAGAGLEQRLPGEVTVLMLAAALGLPELVSRLLQAGADLHATDAQGLTPLHCAALYGFTARERPRLVALLDTLLLAGSDPQQSAAGGVTPLLLLLGARAEPGTPSTEDVVLAGLERLFDEDVPLDARDQRGFGPLHLAALHGLLRIAQALLREGADLDQRDALNRTPREIAVMRGYVDVAAELAPQGGAPSQVSMARFLREP
ncbi:ankyrin repeat domain-containing protein [Thermomonas sp. HDW16]|uniref:ankyrin repeat domain-containing protein n=1 Tax=Thermomonas sp. HDW16 TaxID=2714945 RepID=UPI001F0D9069|nr:ankyrin repeat domain-containing protein [Thermomonas sp. HDW16]